MMAPLMSYHPFWLRLGLLLVTRDLAAQGMGSSWLGSSEAALRRGLQALVKECLLCGRQMSEESDKVAFWVRKGWWVKG
jgi:hypothetical protein